MHVTVAVAVTVRDSRLRDARLFKSCVSRLCLLFLPPWLKLSISKASDLSIRRALLSHLLLSQCASGIPSTGPLSIFLLVLQINSQCTHLVPPPLIAPHSRQHLSNYACTLYADRGCSASLHNYLAFSDFAKQPRTNALWSTRLFDLRSRPIRVGRSSEYSSYGLWI